MNNQDVLSKQQISDYLKDLPHWREVPGAIAAVFQAKTSASAIELFSDIAGAAEMDQHHPDVDWRYDKVFVTTTSHDAGGMVTTRDIALASKISEHAEALGIAARPELISVVEVCVDSDAPRKIAAQWAAGLGYRVMEDGSLVDPHRRLPAIWFQETASPNPNRLHLDIWGPYSESAGVLDRLREHQLALDEQQAPSFVVATDVQGNRFCLCTEQDR
ncbi:4a-hydroxytetrahydrobiopterin dehydratase [Glutamicibacter sp. TV12E]|uniref:4a-hydroxytetrahydrobiopterin dehydratase n=1 Tax=Glutamicibacter sp. TV12E TaxID=3446362 RepID=UPI00403428CD